MATPSEDIMITSFGKQAVADNMRIKSESLLGSNEKIRWKKQDDAMVTALPSDLPAWKVIAFRIELRN